MSHYCIYLAHECLSTQSTPRQDTDGYEDVPKVILIVHKHEPCWKIPGIMEKDTVAVAKTSDS